MQESEKVSVQLRSPSADDGDVEAADTFLKNEAVTNFAWQDINVQVKDGKAGGVKTILCNNSGSVSAGQFLALMGPSGSGKSTLLNALANRSRVPHTGDTIINGSKDLAGQISQFSSYVEQEDVHFGGLTVGENLAFTSQLASPKTSEAIRRNRNQDILRALGLVGQQDTLVSPLFHAGISGGQKRRLSLATALATGPKILFLDEPTSGLDSVASFQIVSFLSAIAKKNGLIIIASIHQPSGATFELFDLVMLISHGRTCYFGARDQVHSFFEPISPAPVFMNPAEYLLDLVNTDFGADSDHANRMDKIFCLWDVHSATNSPALLDGSGSGSTGGTSSSSLLGFNTRRQQRASFLTACWILLHRNFIKSYRDPLAYGTRLLITTGLSLVIGTVWLRLPYDQSSIQPFINCLFFSSAFMALMGVAYAPPIIEDIKMLQKEHANGLYGALPFMVANFFIGLPWLLLITVIFSLVVYWLSNLLPTFTAFVIFVMWLYVDVLAAESLVVLVAAIVPQFVTALAVIAFAHGLWLTVDGFLVPLGTLNAFWKYGFHYINFQTYVFQGLMVNQFKDTIYNCASLPDGGFHCMFVSDLGSQGQSRGTAVLDAYEYSYSPTPTWRWLGCAAAVILVHRIIGFFCLHWRARQHSW